LLGFGQVAEDAHAPAFERGPGFSIVAVADPAPKRLAAARARFPRARAYPSPEALLDSESGLDFVDIAVPPFLHAELAMRALRRRLHVLCEKPLALTARDFESLRAEAARQKKALFPVHNWKHCPQFSALHALLREGAVGEPRHLQLHALRRRPASVRSGSNWRTDRGRAGGGILVDHGWHNLYLACWLMDRAPRSASAFLNFPGHASGGRHQSLGGGTSSGYPSVAESEDEAVCLVRFEAASAVLVLSWRAPVRGQWGVVYGSSGSVELLDDALLLRRGEDPPQTIRFPEKISASSAHPEWFSGTLRDFRSAAAKPEARCAELEEAGHCAALIESLYAENKEPAR
ncbi:MAG: Gfo/Idh/MocA family oxidoreductase, partial [Elusimicrobiota bacterium]